MKKILGVLFLSFFLVSCLKEQDPKVQPLCKIAFKAIAGAGQGIGEVLGCANIPAITADLSEPLQKLDICSGETQQGVLGDLICPRAADIIVDMGVGNLPAEWACSGGPVAVNVKEIFVDACKVRIGF